MKKYFIAGGAGFIGSHLASYLIEHVKDARVTVFDNFTSGSLSHLAGIARDKRLLIIKDDISRLKALAGAIRGCDVVYHFASNPDIARAATEPDIDFWQGTYLVHNVLEAMRITGVKRIMYASGSGVYGDTGSSRIAEDHAPLMPISTYGASKLAGEALICAYCHMFGMKASVFRFANVVGPRQTHGVAFDFIRKLHRDPRHLSILGNGRQTKSYIYVDDVISALRLAEKKQRAVYDSFNVATNDTITVARIADMVTAAMGLCGVKYHYSSGSRGWKGDVPVVRLISTKIRRMGWDNAFSSEEAMRRSIRALIRDADISRQKAGRP